MPLITVKPIQYVPEALGAWKGRMPGIVDNMALVLPGGAEKVEKRFLACFNGINVIEFFIKHENGYLYMRPAQSFRFGLGSRELGTGS
jgi:hypothetical protein